MERAVAITGIGLVTPLGLDAATTWAALLAGTRGVGPISRFDATAFRSRIAAEVKGFDPLRWVDPKKVRETDRFTQFALAAAQMAWADAGLGDHPVGDRGGAIVGSGMGGLETIERYHDVLREKGPGRISPYFVPASIANLASRPASASAWAIARWAPSPWGEGCVRWYASSVAP